MGKGSENIKIDQILNCISENPEVIAISDEIEFLCTEFSTCDEQGKPALANTITNLAFELFEKKAALLGDLVKNDEEIYRENVSQFFPELARIANKYEKYLQELPTEQ